MGTVTAGDMEVVLSLGKEKGLYISVFAHAQSNSLAILIMSYNCTGN